VELAADDATAQAALAEAYLVRDDPGEAVKAAEKAAKLDPNSAQVQAVLARVYLMDRQYEPAYQAARQAVELGPDLAEAYYTLGRVHWAMADFARARAALTKAIALEPQFVPWQVSLGNLLIELQLYDQAIAQFQQALAIVPDYVLALLGQARVHTRQRAYDQAQALIEKAVQVMPDAVEPYLVWGQLYLPQEDYDHAVARFQHAVDQDPDDWSAQIGLAGARLQRGDCESAARMFQDLSADRPRFAEAHIGDGVAKWCLGDPRRALELMRKAAELEPFNPQAHFLLAELYRTQERWEDATRAYIQALRVSPVGADVHGGLGSAYLSQAQMQPAEAEFQVAERLDAEAVEGYSGLCVTYLNQGKATKALPECKQALALQEKNVDRRRQWAIALLQAGRPQEAAEVLKKIAVEKPEDMASRYYLGLAYRDLKDYASALKEVEAYQKLSQTDDFRIQGLIDALKEGYALRQDKAVADLSKTGQTLLKLSVDVRVETTDKITRTLTLEFKAKSGEESSQIYQQAFTLIVLTALTAPRVEPAINGGALLRAKDARGQPFLTIRAGARDLKDFGDGILSAVQFGSRLKFPRESDQGKGPELTDALVKATTDGVAKLRDLTARTPVTFHRLTQAALVERLNSSMDARVREATQHDQALLRLLGLIKPDVNLQELYRDLTEEQVLGFYDPKTKTFYLVEGKIQGVLDRLAIAHEYVHALQDQQFGVERVTDEKLDADHRLAFSALIEGDAVLAMTSYAQEQIPIEDQIQLASLARSGTEMEALEASPAVLRESLLFPYVQGLAFVTSIQASGGWAAVNELYSKPPVSTEQILHPERYRTGDAPAAVSLPGLATTLGGDWRQVDSDVLGELGLRLFLAQYIGPAAAEVAAEGWGGDRYALLKQGSAETYALVIRTTWDDQDAAREFFALVRNLMAHRAGYNEQVKDVVEPDPVRYWQGPDAYWVARQEGKSVTIVVGPSEEIVQQLLAALSGS
jgi:tetratricopeptide (TPR) repeat protein